MLPLLIVFFQFFEQLLFQMATCGFFDRAPFSRHCFLFSLALSSCPSYDRLCQMGNLRTTRTDFSFLWFRVRIHEETLAFLVRDKKNGDRSELKND